VEANASGRQLLQVQHRRNHPLAVEEIEGPAQHQIRMSAVRLLHQPGELRPFAGALPPLIWSYVTSVQLLIRRIAYA